MILVGVLLAAAVRPVEAAITLTLTITPSTISFPDANPRATPSIPANTTVDIYVKVAGAKAPDRWAVRALAAGDLASGSFTIPIANVTWTATPVAGSCSNCVCVAGTMSKSAGQTMFSGQGNTAASGRTCRYSFFLANSWTYRLGFYSQVVTITVTSP
jgi:hypothetical protein